jgi:glycosyltransferase involved in cell wall biosynthesis
MDWNALTPAQRASPNAPTINLIQGFMHADPNHPLYEFLRYPAVRICVSQGVADAILATGRVNGPVRAIENGIDMTGAPPPRSWLKRTHDVLVCGHKWPALAKDLVERLPKDLNVALEKDFIPRSQLLAKFSDARIVVCLGPEGRPGGFLLPAIEAMAQGALVVTFDFIGNRNFCLPNETCLLSDATSHGLSTTVMRGYSMPDSERRRIIRNARTLASQSLDKERFAFRRVLSDLDELWQQTRALPAH